MPRLNLDTHILIHALQGDITPRERRVLISNTWGVSAIVLWELAKLVELGRLEMDLDDPDVRNAISSIHVWPLDLEVASAMTRLDFPGDPADMIIAATSIVHGVPLVTRDERIRKSSMVPFAT